VIKPDGATNGCDVFAMPDDLPVGNLGLRFEFDLEPSDNGMFQAVHLKEANDDEIENDPNTQNAPRDRNLEDGYSGSGESIYTRRAARTGHGVLLKGQVANETRGTRPRRVIIEENLAQLSKLRCELLIEDDAARRAKLEKNIDIKSRFVARIKLELGK
jgi:hypothetical protein